MKFSFFSEKSLHKFFEISVFLKGIDAVLQVIAGVVLWIVDPAKISHWILSLIQNELLEDPHDFFARLIYGAARHFSSGVRLFEIVFLLSHGFIKLFLVWGLLKKWFWVYPAAIAVFTMFIVYQMYRYVHTHEMLMLIFSILDVLVIVLTWHEYRSVKRRNISNKA